MNRRLLLFCSAGALALLGPVTARADKQLSPDLLDRYDRRGYFPPGFKAAIHAYVEAKEDLDRAKQQQKQSERELPALLQQAAAAQTKTAALRQELAKYDHPDETDFIALKAQADNPAAPLQDVIAVAEAYVWTYPASPHQADAQRYLFTFQQKLAAQEQAAKDAEAARQAAHARLLARAQAHDLSLPEWRDFLRGMSQSDLVELFGQPSSKQDDYWFYDGEWTQIPATAQKVGLQINFEAGRVINVDAKPPPP